MLVIGRHALEGFILRDRQTRQTIAHITMQTARPGYARIGIDAGIELEIVRDEVVGTPGDQAPPERRTPATTEGE